MNVKRYVAENSRLAMRWVKQELGEDAVILSSRQVPGGFELVAIAQSEMADLTGAGGPGRAGPGAPRPRESAPAPVPGAQSLVDFALARSNPAPERAAEATGRAGPRRESVPALPAPAPADAGNPGQAAPGPDLMAELKSMRVLFEGQLSRLAWTESARRAPLRMKLAGRLLAAGFSARLARSATARLPDDFTEAQANRWLSALLEANLRRAPEDELIAGGGVYALIGPTGVGKTTTTAKLAARFVMNHGAAGLGLISADSYRIGAQDQLRIYGRILGVPVHAVQDAGELHAALEALHDKKLVLIDTIGVGQRDPRVAEQVALLGREGIRRILLLNAACQAETLDDVVTAYRGNGIHGCCLTKIDEAVKLGGALGCAMRHRLPLHYVSNGQRVPEDLHLPVLPDLVQRAIGDAAVTPFALDADDAALMLAPMPEGALVC